MAVYGKIEEFNCESEDWTPYAERIGLYFEANGIADEKKVAIFLSVCGAKCYNLLRNLLAPDKPGDKTCTTVHCAKEPFQSQAIRNSTEIQVQQQTSQDW